MKRTWALAVLIALVVVSERPRAIHRTDLELTVDGSVFKVNGNQTFLAVASYFDAIHGDLTTIDSDFGTLASDGFNAVRIFPNWFRETGNPDSATTYLAQDTLFDKDGGLRSGALNKLLDVLDLAKDHGLIVDLTFTAETVVDCPMDNCTSGTSALSFDEYKSAIEAITTELANAGSAYKHVMFDLQNEADKAENGPYDLDMDEGDIGELAEAVKAIDSDRIVFASLQSTTSPTDSATYAETAETDVAVLHENRDCGWGNDSGTHVDDMQLVTSKPIYFQESPRYDTRSGSDNSSWFSNAQLKKSLYEAKLSGAAAWNFHTRSGMNLNHTWNSSYSIFTNLATPESSFVSPGLSDVLSCTGGGCPTASVPDCSEPAPDAARVFEPSHTTHRE